MNFPKDFIWGGAASSYQIEGAAYKDGGGLSVWDMFVRQDGKIVNQDTGHNACDHVARYKDDITLMSDIGFQAYRFSVSWPRVLPNGTGSVNQKGLDFYSKLVDTLLEKNITPWLTLFHWDFPYDLFCKGGWLNRDSADWFADYTEIVVDKLSDRVAHWCTINEPQVYIGLGHQEGIHAPGLKLGFAECLLGGHNTLRAHGKAVQTIRSRSILTSKICASQACKVAIPDDESGYDVLAARERMFDIRERNFFNSTWFSDPIFLGEYPSDGVDLFGSDMPRILDGDMETIAQPLDYFGTNIYWGDYIRANGERGGEVVARDNLAYTDFNWPVTPEALYWGPKFFHERYRSPVVITENGMAAADHLTDGRVHDEARIGFLEQYLSQFGRAIQDGVDCAGYFVWSVLDNFEWAEGYSKRFGIIHVDYETQKRTLKDSAYWYKQVIESNKIVPMKAGLDQGLTV